MASRFPKVLIAALVLLAASACGKKKDGNNGGDKTVSIMPCRAIIA